MIAIVAPDDLFVANAQRRLAAIAAMRADGSNVVHFPRPRLVSVRSARQCADRADVDAHSALVALQMIEMIWSDLGVRAAIDHAKRVHAHAFVANSHAAIAENAARSIEE